MNVFFIRCLEQSRHLNHHLLEFQQRGLESTCFVPHLFFLLSVTIDRGAPVCPALSRCWGDRLGKTENAPVPVVHRLEEQTGINSFIYTFKVTTVSQAALSSVHLIRTFAGGRGVGVGGRLRLPQGGDTQLET